MGTRTHLNVTLYVRYLSRYFIILLTFLCGSNLLKLHKVCGLHMCDFEGYCLLQCNDISVAEIYWLSEERTTASLECVCPANGVDRFSRNIEGCFCFKKNCSVFVLLFLGGSLYFIIKLYLFLYVRVVHNVLICYCTCHSWFVGLSTVVNFFLCILFCNVTLGLKVTVLSYSLVH